LGGALKKEIFTEKGYMVYEQRNAISNDCMTGRYFISESKYREMEDFSVKPGDILVSCSGTIGRVVIVPENAPKGIINQALLRIRVNTEKVTPEYVKIIFESTLIQNKLNGISHGTGLKNFPPMSEVKSLQLPIPSLDLQFEIAHLSRSVEALKTSYQMSIKDIDSLFESSFVSIAGLNSN